MTDLARTLAALSVGIPALSAGLVSLAPTPRHSDLVARTAGLATALPVLALATLALAHGGAPLVDGRWTLVDRASGLMLAITGLVGLASVLMSPSYLRTGGRSWLSPTASHAWYYTVLFVFWAALIAAPLADNLALVWLIIDATTATSALLVSFSGRREALEAGWKYLILTTLGLSLALFGIILIAIAQGAAGHHGLAALDWQALGNAARALPHGTVVAGFVLLIVGLATKIGWAPVHNWLPDAHSEAPAPVSALLSSTLLPTVMLVAWRAKEAPARAVGASTASALFVGLGLASILVAVPFLWKTMPWKRLLAYSSLEHMGIIAVGIGFGTPVAITGVIIHVAGHAFAKSLGFYAAQPPRRIALGVSLVALGGLPPSPLFVSELLIVLGGIASGHPVLAAITAVAVAAGFLGLLHGLIEGIIGDRELSPLPPSLAGGEL